MAVLLTILTAVKLVPTVHNVFAVYGKIIIVIFAFTSVSKIE